MQNISSYVNEKYAIAVLLEFLDSDMYYITLPVKMFGPFWSVWYKMALAEVGVSLP